MRTKKRGEKDDKIARTITFNYRGDMRDIATLIHIYEDLLNTPIRTKATLMRLVAHDYAELLVENIDKAKKFESTDEAYRYLRVQRLMEEDERPLTKARVERLREEGEFVPTVGAVLLPADLQTLSLEEAKKHMEYSDDKE